MDWKEFVASIVGSLAWPAAIVALVVVLRRPLRALLGSLQTLQYREFRAEFGRHIREAQANVEEAVRAGGVEVTVGEQDQHVPDKEVTDLLRRLANETPRAAVLEAWTVVESELRSGEGRLGKESDGPVPRLLAESGWIPQLVKVLEGLYAARNQAAHADEVAITPEDASEYVETATSAAHLLREQYDMLVDQARRYGARE